MKKWDHLHVESMDRSATKKVVDSSRKELTYEFDLKDFLPEVYDCEADGGCSSGHIHFVVKQ